MIQFRDDMNWQSALDAGANVHHLSNIASDISSWKPEAKLSPTRVLSAGFRRRPLKLQSFYFTPDPLSESPATDADKQIAAMNPDKSTPSCAQTTSAPNANTPTLHGENDSDANESAPHCETNAGKKNAGEDKKDEGKQSRTRIQPPGDVVKLDDRMFYLLQPPLENLLSGNTLQFPFKPFRFQYSGVGFLFPRHRAILADEMGLGKTMQAITSIRMLLRTGQAKSILLICPKPLVTNWLSEFELWAPEIPVAAVQGSTHQRRWHWTCNRAPVKIANYELMIRDEHVLQEAGLKYDLVVLDEAQRIKNKNNSTSKVIHSIERSRSWALTGTPIENSLEDLVGICQFVSPGTVHSGMSPRQMRTELKDIILRRTKDLVMKDMPPRIIKDAEMGLTPEQALSYEQAETDGVLRLNSMGDEVTIKHVFELVLRLKQICNFDHATGQSTKAERLSADLDEIAASGQKAIVFSQFVDTIQKIIPHVDRHNPLEYHGRIPSRKRDAILDEFKNDPSRTVLLMSYGAGSVGLNLQFCRYVFLFDRWWNPAVEDQAINRAHRIGAAGSVTVTRMIMAGTIEQRIHDILEAKRELFREVLSDSDRPAKRGLTRDEIFGLFKLTTPQGTIRKSSIPKAA